MQHLIFFRNRAAETEGTLADLVHQTGMYYEDRLSGTGFSRVLLAGSAGGGLRQTADVEQARQSLEGRLTAAVETVDPRTAVVADRSHLGGARAPRYAGAARRPAASRPGDGGVIRTNLSTRPFYNERAVQLVLLGAGLVVLAATLFNVTRILQLSRQDTQLATQAASDEARARDLIASAAKRRATVDPRALELASVEARQANDLIDRRTFSWTELFNRFETTEPDEVRITAVRPRLDPKRGTVVTIIDHGQDRRGRESVHRPPRSDRRIHPVGETG